MLRSVRVLASVSSTKGAKRGGRRAHLGEAAKEGPDPALDARVALLGLPLVQQLLLGPRLGLGIRRRDVLALVVLDDGPHVLDALDRQRLEERNHGDQFVGRRVALGTLPRLEHDGVVRLELDPLGVDVEDDGALEGPVQVRQVLDVGIVLVPRRLLEQLPGDVGPVGVDLLDLRDGELRARRVRG